MSKSEYLTLESKIYPANLRDIPSPPKQLYYKGKLDSKSFDKCLAVVGSRYMTGYGKRVIEHIFRTLSKDTTIVSGFMCGVDMEAHRQAIMFGLKTIAVMPCGINYAYPKNQLSLYSKIISKEGLILSEYPSSVNPEIWMYPRRNRIVAGISKAVLVIEASCDSGSVLTANIANSFGRKVFVVPGSIFSPLSKGKMQLSNEYAVSVDSGININKYMSS